MKKNNHPPVENALSLYKETVSPSEQSLHVLLSQIPEQQKQEKRRAVRSPYIWLAVTQLVMVCSIILIMVSTINQPGYLSNPFYQADKQIDQFESTTLEEDYQKSLIDYTL